ncbi:hypothetical protein V5799_010301 [Amblyomma americanum]|uniref:Uncharacterized protein n=1 Tax=Amblyomma americanum TaxID=6943 RepID=A0AAQ4F8D2_AMBAM
MEALRNWRPAIKGATPTREADDPLACGRHERAMMVACLSNLSAGTALGYASTSMPYIERESWYDLERSSPQNRWAADVLLLGAAAGALLSVFVLQSYVIESPRWLQSKGRYRDTNTAIVQLYGDDLPTDFRLSKIGEDSALSSLGRQKCTRMLSVCLLLNLLQTLSCSPLLLLRAVQVVGPLQDVMSSHEAATLVVAMHVGSAALFTVLTRCVGRRLLLGASAVLVAVVLSAMQPLDYMVFSSASLATDHPCTQWSAGQKVPDGTRWDALCSTWLLALTYSVGLCHVPPLLTVELLPLKRWRYLTSSCVWTGRWLLAFALVHCDDELFGDEGGDRQQPLSWAFSLALVLVTAAAAFFAPHTEGRPLADIHRDE